MEDISNITPEELFDAIYYNTSTLTLEQLLSIYTCALSEKKVEILRVFLECEAWSLQLIGYAYTFAISNNDIELCRILCNIMPYYDKSFMELALSTSRVMTEFCYNIVGGFFHDDLVFAILRASDETLSFITRKGYDLNTPSLRNSVQERVKSTLRLLGSCGLLDETFERLFDYGCFQEQDTINRVISYCSLAKVKTLHKKGCKFPEHFFFTHDPHVEEFLHINRLAHYSPCKHSLCDTCRVPIIDTIEELWELKDYTYDNVLQWLPREMKEDVVSLI